MTTPRPEALRTRRPYRASIGMDALVVRADGSSINFGDAIYHPENVDEARAYAAAMTREPFVHGSGAYASSPLVRQLVRLRADAARTPAPDLRAAAQRVIEIVDEPSPQDDGTPEVEALWYLRWEERHLAAVEALRAALGSATPEPTLDVERLAEAYLRLLRARHETAHNGDIVTMGTFEKCDICQPSIVSLGLDLAARLSAPTEDAG